MTSCLHCGAETTNGLALCDLSQTKAAKVLDMLPVYYRNLARIRRPARPNGSLSGGGSGSDDPRPPVDVILGWSENMISTWVRCLVDDRGVEIPDRDTEADQVAALCRLLAEHLTSIATLEWAGEFVTDLGRHEERLRRLTEEAAPGWYAGGCERCGSGTYVVPGLTWVTCKSCGVTTYARDHLETILDEARDWVAQPKALAEAIVALVDSEQSVVRLAERIKKWAQRGRIAVYRGTEINEWGETVPSGPKRYRLGDLLDRLSAEGQTRTAKKKGMMSA